MLNLAGEVLVREQITEGQALENIAQVCDFIHVVMDSLPRCAVLEEKSGARFALVRESRVFAPRRC